MKVVKPARILFLADGLGAGGAERQMCLLAENLSSDWETPAVCSLHDGYFRTRLEKAGIQVICLGENLSFMKQLTRLRRTVQKCKPDLIHCWGSASVIMAELLFRHRIPIVNGTVRRSHVPEEFLPKLRLRISSRLGDVTVSNSQAALNALQLTGPRYVVIHNGFSQVRNLADQSSMSQLDPELINLVMCANIKPGKDYGLLLKAAAKLRSFDNERDFKYRFWFIGEVQNESYFSELKSIIEEFQLEVYVNFTGRVDSPASYLAGADIALLLNDTRFHSEGISNSIMEYMAAGLPVICTDAGGNRELVNSDTGMFVPPGDAVAVCEAIRSLTSERKLAQAMGEAGRNRIAQEFSMDKMVGKYTSLYLRISG